MITSITFFRLSSSCVAQFCSQIHNMQDPNKPFTSLNLHNVLKLTPKDYLSMKMQVEAILVGYDDPSYFWVRQHKILWVALMGTISEDLGTLISQITTFKVIWDAFSKTYAISSCDHIKQLKDGFQCTFKGHTTITKYMQTHKNCDCHLASLGKKIDQEDLLGLDDGYNSVIESIYARDTPFSFKELHKKLITKELSIQQAPPPLLFTYTPRHPPCHWTNNFGLLPTPSSTYKTPQI